MSGVNSGIYQVWDFRKFGILPNSQYCELHLIKGLNNRHLIIDNQHIIHLLTIRLYTTSSTDVIFTTYTPGARCSTETGSVSFNGVVKTS